MSEGYGLAGAVGSLLGAAIGYFANKETNETNMQINQNMLDYNSQMTQEQWERDDTAHQREVADLEAAGLSPLAALGGAPNSSALGAPSPIAMQAPQIDVNSIVQSVLGAKQLEETERHNKATEQYQSGLLSNEADRIENEAAQIKLNDKELQHKIQQDAKLLKLQADSLDEIKSQHRKENEMRLSELQQRRLEEESKRWSTEIMAKSGGHNYQEYNDFETYYNANKLFLVKYSHFLETLESSSSADANSRSHSLGGNAGVSGAGTGFTLGANSSSSGSEYHSEDNSERVKAALEKFFRENPVPVYISRSDYKNLNEARGKN